MSKLKLDFELLAVVIFAGIFLWFSAGNILDNKINHEYPVGYFASDSFQNYGIAEGLKEQGNYKYQPFAVAGGFKDVVGTHYPILYHLAVIVSNFTGITTYDSLILTVILMLLGMSLTAYLIIRKYNKKIAIISLPLMILVSYGKFSSVVTWGQHGTIAGSLYMLGLLWALAVFGLNDIIFIIIFLSSAMLGHAQGFFFGSMFFGLYVLIKLITKELRLSEIKKLFLIGASTFIITFYYYIILKNAWINQGYTKLDFSTVEKFLQGGAFPLIVLSKDFNIGIVIVAVIGIIISLVLYTKSKNVSLLAFLFLFFTGFFNYIGFAHRAFQQRFLWPIYVSALVGVAIYFALRLAIKKVKTAYAFVIFIILISSLVFAYKDKTQPGSMLDKYHWDSFIWIQKNVPKDDTVYFFYQDMTTQHSLYYASSQRKSYVIEFEKFKEAVASRQVKRLYGMVASAEAGAGLPYRKSFFKYGYHTLESPKALEDDFDICSMKYIVFDKLSRYKVFSDYNLLLMSKLKNNSWMEEISINPLVSILKNNKQGEKCIDGQ